MKNVIDHKPVRTDPGLPCSEEKCVTCFQQRGCLYEQFLFIVIANLEEPPCPKPVTAMEFPIGNRA